MIHIDPARHAIATGLLHSASAGTGVSGCLLPPGTTPPPR